MFDSQTAVIDRQGLTREWYGDYYGKKGLDRNDLRTNRGVLLQIMATEASLVRAAYDISLPLHAARILDVGCGGAGDLYQLLRLGVRAENTTGIDILPDRVANARSLYPHATFVEGDASRMDFADDAFDLVFESTMFATLPDDELSADIAREMIRVCRPGGYLLLVDWWMPKPGDTNYKALTPKRLRQLFGVGGATTLCTVQRGALVPPLGRFLSKHLPSLYFPIAKVFPYLTGQVTYLLQKSISPAYGELCHKPMSRCA